MTPENKSTYERKVSINRIEEENHQVKMKKVKLKGVKIKKQIFYSSLKLFPACRVRSVEKSMHSCSTARVT